MLLILVNLVPRGDTRSHNHGLLSHPSPSTPLGSLDPHLPLPLSRPIILRVLRVSFHPLQLSLPIIFWELRTPLYLFLLSHPITLWVLRVSFHIHLGHLTFFLVLRIPLFLFHPSCLTVGRVHILQGLGL
ncbi:hypothetical protein Taro_017368 [Colocasia esculenta]|uniref:Uncharacterized protein n=1 Tax=Colocasia esculenta TaxID=4460 RepID=A0A843UR61_COLES|nr:hypothetical protein [Colocasia esculenta]